MTPEHPTDSNPELQNYRPGIELQTPQQFRDDFVAMAGNAENEVFGVVLQIEPSEEANPIYDAMLLAKERGVDTRLVFHPVTTGHIARYDNGQVHEGHTLRGKVIRHSGDKGVAQEAHQDRADLISRLKDAGVIQDQSGPKLSRSANNHIKLFVSDNTVWFGTMNLRASDFEMSNFMMKTNDPEIVRMLKEVFIDSTENPGACPNKIYSVSADTELLYDGGIRRESIIFDRAMGMARRLDKGDRFVMIGQYPPVGLMYGDLLRVLKKRMRSGVDGKFLMPPAEKLHPVMAASRLLQKTIQARQQRITGMNVVNLACMTHVKAFLVFRANGSQEALFGSHNLTSWTVKIGNKELSMHTTDPNIINQLAEYIDSLKIEQN